MSPGAPIDGAAPALRTVLLSKPHPLTSYIARELARHTNLVGIVFEERLSSSGSKVDTLKKLAKREGIVRAVDVAAYELYERLARRGAYTRALRRELPADVLDDSALPLEPRSFADLNSAEARAYIESLAPDVLVVHATAILKPETFGLARRYAINIHGGVLPRYRGHASTFWALADGDLEQIGVTVHEVAAKVDSGVVYGLGTVRPTPDDDDFTLWFRSIVLGTRLLIEFLDRAARGEAAGSPMPGPLGPHFRRKGLTDYFRRLRPRLRALSRNAL